MVAAFALCVHCGQSVGPSDAATDASAGDVEADGAPLDAAWDPDASCYPPCLAALLAHCPTGTTCVQQTVSSTYPEEARYCFPSGTIEDNIVQESGHNVDVVRDGTGAICFTYVGELNTDPVAGTFLNAEGRVVATFSTPHNSSSGQVTISCDGASYAVDVYAPICDGHIFGFTGPCTMGTCPP